MTPLKPTVPGKGLKRAIPAPIIGRGWTIELDAFEIRVREKGRRAVYSLPWEFVVKAAAAREADRIIEQRKANRRKGGA